MLDGKETGSFVGSDHEGEMSISRWGAGVFSAEVDEVGSSLISPVSLINPVSLLIGSLRVVLVVNPVGEPKLLKVVVVDIRKQVGINVSVSGCFSGEGIE